MMKRIAVLALAAVMSAATVTYTSAHESHDAKGAAAKQAPAKQAAAPAAGAKTIRGELVDMGCYLGHEARGEKHIGCATKCIAGGMPMGILTADGTLYLVTMNHTNPDPYNAIKELAGRTLDVTGELMARGGIKGIDVTGYKLVSAQSQ